VTGRPAAARPAGISQIITWCARLTAAGSRAGTAEVAACLTAKASLPGRIAAGHAAGGPASRDVQAAREAAASARADAAAAAAAGRITTGKDQP
jgi:hypothetical protein